MDQEYLKTDKDLNLIALCPKCYPKDLQPLHIIKHKPGIVRCDNCGEMNVIDIDILAKKEKENSHNNK